MVLRPGFGPGSAAFSQLSGVERPLYMIPSRFDRTILPEHWTRLLAFEVYFRSSSYSVADRSGMFILPAELAKGFLIDKVLKPAKGPTDSGLRLQRQEPGSVKLEYV